MYRNNEQMAHSVQRFIIVRYCFIVSYQNDFYLCIVEWLWLHDLTIYSHVPMSQTLYTSSSKMVIVNESSGNMIILAWFLLSVILQISRCHFQLLLYLSFRFMRHSNWWRRFPIWNFYNLPRKKYNVGLILLYLCMSRSMAGLPNSFMHWRMVTPGKTIKPFVLNYLKSSEFMTEFGGDKASTDLQSVA